MHNYLSLGIVAVLAVLALVLVFTDNSSVGLAQYSVERCHLQDGFEANFESKNDCMLALKDLCTEQCSDINNCVRVSRSACSQIGRGNF